MDYYKTAKDFIDEITGSDIMHMERVNRLKTLLENTWGYGYREGLDEENDTCACGVAFPENGKCRFCGEKTGLDNLQGNCYNCRNEYRKEKNKEYYSSPLDPTGLGGDGKFNQANKDLC